MAEETMGPASRIIPSIAIAKAAPARRLHRIAGQKSRNTDGSRLKTVRPADPGLTVQGCNSAASCLLGPLVDK